MENIRTYLKITALLFLLLGVSCSTSSTTSPIVEEDPRAKIKSMTLIGSYSGSDLKALLQFGNSQIDSATLVDFNNTFSFSHNIDLYKVVYTTSDHTGKVIECSGAFVLPKMSSSMPLISIQHGTVVSQTRVPSSGISITNFSSVSLELLLGLFYGSDGYVVTLPDYIGYGVSETMPAYLNAQSYSYAVTDLLRAIQSYCGENNIALNGKTFLSGYSEGGYATLATQRYIEENYPTINLTAVVPMSGPYDLSAMTDYFISSDTLKHIGHGPFVFTAYNKYENWNLLPQMFKAPYNTMVEDLFSGKYSRQYVDSILPDTYKVLFTEEFLSNVIQNTNNGQTVRASFQKNSLLNWAPRTPIKFTHGDQDEIVPYSIVTSTITNLQSAGAQNITIEKLGGKNHYSAFFPSVIIANKWFDSFK